MKVENCACGRKAKAYTWSTEDIDGIAVGCISKLMDACWKGPIKKTERGAVASWNKLMSTVKRSG
jgi:hypothetical protein